MMNIIDIQPSQLYLNAVKIAKIEELYWPITFETIPPIPIKKLENDIIFVDGHTRAYVAYKRGVRQIKVYWEDEELDWEMYKICINWCKEEEIRNIFDLKYKIVRNKEYQALWIDRCHKLQESLRHQRNSDDK